MGGKTKKQSQILRPFFEIGRPCLSWGNFQVFNRPGWKFLNDARVVLMKTSGHILKVKRDVEMAGSGSREAFAIRGVI